MQMSHLSSAHTCLLSGADSNGFFFLLCSRSHTAALITEIQVRILLTRKSGEWIFQADSLCSARNTKRTRDNMDHQKLIPSQSSLNPCTYSGFSLKYTSCPSPNLANFRGEKFCNHWVRASKNPHLNKGKEDIWGKLIKINFYRIP
jgi:hypothetical protein